MAARLEELSFDRISLADSPNLAGEVFGQLVAASSATERIEIGTGVTNSVSRQAAVVASAIASVQIMSQGRTFCGIGRGDSAVYKLGLRPHRLADFEIYVRNLRSYVRGGGVDLGLEEESRLEWLPDNYVPPPIEVVASGPKMLRIAGRVADRIGLGVGANPDHVRQKIGEAREAVRQAGRDPDAVEYGAYVTCVVGPDASRAQELVRPIAATFVNFMAMRGQGDGVKTKLPAGIAETAQRVADDYVYDSEPGRSSSGVLTPELLDWFSVAGTPGMVTKRFEDLASTGLDYVFIVSRYHALPPNEAGWHLTALGKEVFPAVRETLTDGR